MKVYMFRNDNWGM